MSVKSINDLMDRVGLLFCQVDNSDDLITIYSFFSLLFKLKKKSIVINSEQEFIDDSIFL